MISAQIRIHPGECIALRFKLITQSEETRRKKKKKHPKESDVSGIVGSIQTTALLKTAKIVSVLKRLAVTQSSV